MLQYEEQKSGLLLRAKKLSKTSKCYEERTVLTGRAIMRAEPLGQLVTRLWNPSATYSGLDQKNIFGSLLYFLIGPCLEFLCPSCVFCSRHDLVVALNLSSHCTGSFLRNIFEEKDVEMIEIFALFYIFGFISRHF